MKNRKAVYAASLDPITNGHINVIERIARLYDKVVVMVAVDPRKKYMFSQEERVEMAKAATRRFRNVTVVPCVHRYVAEYAKAIKAQVMIRGIRNFKDVEDESGLAIENRNIAPRVETLWIPCVPELVHVSSSLVKIHMGAARGWVRHAARLVPPAVLEKLKEKYLATVKA